MIEDIKISIIVPIYNCEENLPRCIESVLDQSYKNFELILIDDGSKDDSYNISVNYKKKDYRIQLFQQKNKGASSARNFGLSKVKGEYLMFIDSDDFIEYDMIQTLVSTVKNTNADYVISSFFINKYELDGKLIAREIAPVKERLITSNSQLTDSIIDLVENERINAPWGKLIKSSIIKDNKLWMPEHITLQEDLYFNIMILNFVNIVSVINEPKYHYVVGSKESLTSRYFENKFEMVDEVFNLLYDFYVSRSTNNNLISRIKYIYVKNVYASFINLFHPQCGLNKENKIKHINNIFGKENFDLMVGEASKSGVKYHFLGMILRSKNSVLLYYFSKFLSFLKNRLNLKF